MATQADLLARSARFVRRFLGKSETEGAPEQILGPLEEPFRSALLSMYRNEAQEGLDQEPHPIDPSLRIPPSQGMWLYENCRTRRSRSVLEIGTAYGYSALFILATKFGIPSKRKYVVKAVLPYTLVSPDTIRDLCRLTCGPGVDIVYAADEAIPAQLKQGPFAAALGKPIVCFADARGLPEFVEEDCGYGVLYMNMEALTGRD